MACSLWWLACSLCTVAVDTLAVTHGAHPVGNVPLLFVGPCEHGVGVLLQLGAVVGDVTAIYILVAPPKVCVFMHTVLPLLQPRTIISKMDYYFFGSV